MTPFRHASKRRARERHAPMARIILIVFAVFIVALVFHGLVFKRGVMTPFLVFASSVEDVSARTLGNLDSKRSLLARIDELESELAMRDNEHLAYQAVVFENETLKTALGRRSEAATTLLARVIAHPMQSIYDTFIIDEGESEGVAEGDLVLAEGNVAIGRVAEVFQHSAAVSLLSTRGVRTDATLATGALSVTLVGRGGGNFEISLPRETDLVPDDYVIMGGSPVYLVAELPKELTDPRDPVKTVILRSPVNMWHLSWVEVVKPTP